jgi:hypothetical protein
MARIVVTFVTAYLPKKEGIEQAWAFQRGENTFRTLIE